MAGHGVHSGGEAGPGYPRADSAQVQDSAGAAGAVPPQRGEVRRGPQQVHLPHGSPGTPHSNFLYIIQLKLLSKWHFLYLRYFVCDE